MAAVPLHRPWPERLLGPWVALLGAETLRADALAGLLGAMLVLPQAIAFAALAGLPPAFGLYTAVVPCIVAALAGSSRHVTSGPTNATSLAVAAMLAPLALRGSPDYLRLAVVVTLGVGLIQTAVALLRLGVLANFISPSVMLGFTSGAAVLIAWHALPGLAGVAAPVDAAAWQPGALAVGLGTLAAALLLRRLWRRGPHMLLAMALGTGLAWLLVTRAGATLPLLGPVPRAWPVFAPPPLQWADVPRLASISLALAIVALGQTMAISKALAGLSGDHLDVNRECLGQGLSNIAGSFFTCFVSCGSLNRSLPNFESGARTPLAGVFAALLLVLLVTLAAPLLAWIPMPGISALLLLVAWSLLDLARWRSLWRMDRVETAIAAATFAATLVLRLEVAVLSGVMASLVSYLYRSSRPALRTMGFDRGGPGRPFVVIDDAPPGALPECPQLKLLRMEGSIFFGAVAHVSDHLRALRTAPQPQAHLLVMAKSMNFIDLAGAEMWEAERRARREAGGDLYFHRPRPQVSATWRRTGFTERLGAGHVFDDKHSAIAAIVPRLDDDVCRRCTVRVFEECTQRPGAEVAPVI